MINKKTSRLRRARKARHRIQLSGRARLSVFRSPRHIYAQIFALESGEVLVSCSTVEKAVREQVKNTGNQEAASVVGKLIAQRSVAKGISEVAFDRSGFLYHGRLKRLADAARDNGLKF